MKVALAQVRCSTTNVSSNIDKMVARIDEAASQGCQVVLFPELSDTGYDLERIPDTTSAWTDELGCVQKTSQLYEPTYPCH